MTDNEGVTEGGKDVSAQPRGRLPTLKDRKEHGVVLRAEIVEILRSSGNPWTAAQDIVEAVNRRGLCPHPDGGGVSEWQVRRHTRNYPNLFERQGRLVRLRKPR